MSSNVKASIIIAVSLVATGIAYGGIFSTRTVAQSPYLWRVNRFTGGVMLCSIDNPEEVPKCWDGQMQEGAPTAK